MVAPELAFFSLISIELSFVLFSSILISAILLSIFSTKTSFSFFSFSEILKFSEIFPFFSA
jgi:hypothetical protein